MSRVRQILFLSVTLLLASCASEQAYQAGSSSSMTAEFSNTDVGIDEGAEQQALARQEVERTEAARAAEREEQRAIEARQEAQLLKQQRREEQQRLAQERARAVEQAQALANQQARIEELKAQIAVNNSETENLEAANEVLRSAVNVAQDLSSALSEEQQKYADIDPNTGETLEELATSTLNELNREVERLRAQAQALQSATQ